MSGAVLRRRLSERAVHGAGGVLGVLGVRQVVRMGMGVLVREGVAVRQARGLRRVARAQVRRAAMVLRQRQRRAGWPPVAALLHVRSRPRSRARRASRRAAARAAPAARQRMPPRLVRAPVVALAARHPFRSLLPSMLASPPSGRHPAHPLIRNNYSSTSFLLCTLNFNRLFITALG